MIYDFFIFKSQDTLICKIHRINRVHIHFFLNPDSATLAVGGGGLLEGRECVKRGGGWGGGGGGGWGAIDPAMLHHY